MGKKPSREAKWAEAKKRCRLSVEDVAMAKQLGLNPRSLIKNIPSPTQPWKAPVKQWVQEMYRKRFGQQRPGQPTPSRAGAGDNKPQSSQDASPETAETDDGCGPEDLSERNLLDEAQEALLAEAVEDEIAEQEGWVERMQELERDTPISAGEVSDQNDSMLKLQKALRRAGELIAAQLSTLSTIERVVLFGSVAAPLKKEVPRFSRMRRAGIKVWHECRDLDLAVWITDLSQLQRVKKAVHSALKTHQTEADQNHWSGVPSHQLDIFLLEPTTHRYRGNVCFYSNCPKHKPACNVAGCGAQLFLQLFEDFKFNRFAVMDPSATVLFERTSRPVAPPAAQLEIPDTDCPF